MFPGDGTETLSQVVNVGVGQVATKSLSRLDGTLLSHRLNWTCMVLLARSISPSKGKPRHIRGLTSDLSQRQNAFEKGPARIETSGP